MGVEVGSGVGTVAVGVKVAVGGTSAGWVWVTVGVRVLVRDGRRLGFGVGVAVSDGMGVDMVGELVSDAVTVQVEVGRGVEISRVGVQVAGSATSTNVDVGITKISGSRGGGNGFSRLDGNLKTRTMYPTSSRLTARAIMVKKFQVVSFTLWSRLKCSPERILSPLKISIILVYASLYPCQETLFL